jgi:hypothetical protein
MQIMLHLKDVCASFFRQRVPFLAILTLPLPSAGNRAARLTDIFAFRLHHPKFPPSYSMSYIRTKKEHKPCSAARKVFEARKTTWI